ncbi:GNAT family N-acetyltransferase [Psychrobacillus vulpis]|uniref:GNAT family N-acetyltransferase n=1 Tax=Psychrobacillus vulpis TaxID=2325572 RepID=A0A544TNG5_9BACI|nr:GNAT family N-acetyltransferase [Psychrobacillus vulpis]TQR18998.1 GNAT family N-acetyltransferase [Psychrobacillus vulpis]
MTISLQVVSEIESPILRNLYSLYLHDLSTFTTNIDIAADGFFHFEDLHTFWKIEGISPYFIKYEDSIIGFLLLLERPFLKKDSDYCVNDIFILNKYKGKGLGKQVLQKLFAEKHGRYTVIELVENVPAVSFWKKVYKQLNIEFDEKSELVDGEPCFIQTFSI